jgi:hypothetical protein
MGTDDNGYELSICHQLGDRARIWLPGLDAGYDPQGLAVDGGGIYVSAYRSDSLGVRRGPCRVMRIAVNRR